jgi:hypothetical protein
LHRAEEAFFARRNGARLSRALRARRPADLHVQRRELIGPLRFYQHLLDILNNQKPTHIAVAFDTDAPTQRHKDFADYKIQREAMPEDLSAAMPHVRRMIEGFNIPVLECDGYEADDIIGTLARKAEKQGFDTYMVTPDKDFGNSSTNTLSFTNPHAWATPSKFSASRKCSQNGAFKNLSKVIDILALWGDTSDNIPGVPESVKRPPPNSLPSTAPFENLWQKTSELKGKLKESLEAASRQRTPLKTSRHDQLRIARAISTSKISRSKPINEEAVKQLCTEFEFNSIGKRLFGESFRAGRGYAPPAAPVASSVPRPPRTIPPVGSARPSPTASPEAPSEISNLKSEIPLRTKADIAHTYTTAATTGDQQKLAAELANKKSICFAADFSSDDLKRATLRGLVFSLALHSATYVPIIDGTLELFRPFLENADIEKSRARSQIELHGSQVAWRHTSRQALRHGARSRAGRARHAPLTCRPLRDLSRFRAHPRHRRKRRASSNSALHSTRTSRTAPASASMSPSNFARFSSRSWRSAAKCAFIMKLKPRLSPSSSKSNTKASKSISTPSPITASRSASKLWTSRSPSVAWPAASLMSTPTNNSAKSSSTS